MGQADPREALAALIEQNGAEFSSLSRLLGRNPAYIQQYIRRGHPRRLDERDRKILADFFGVPESVLGGPAEMPAPGLIVVPRLAVGASAGPGALGNEEEARRAPIAFSPAFLRGMASGGAQGLSMISVQGDSMLPTLSEGDEILVDRSDAADRLRDGIYVLRVDDALIVKRVAIQPAGGRIMISSDNGTYPSWPDCDPATITVIGRVLWAGRKVA